MGCFYPESLHDVTRFTADGLAGFRALGERLPILFRSPCIE